MVECNHGRQGAVIVAESQKIGGAIVAENSADGRYGRQGQIGRAHV